jgi:hypothetical protein
MLGSLAYPFFSILAGKAAVHTFVAGSKIVTYGDSKASIISYVLMLC